MKEEELTVLHFLHFTSTWVHPQFFVLSVLLFFLFFSVVLFVLFVFVLCPVFDVACVSSLSILDCPFGFR